MRVLEEKLTTGPQNGLHKYPPNLEAMNCTLTNQNHFPVTFTVKGYVIPTWMMLKVNNNVACSSGAQAAC
jgi:hypothetical protein